MQSAYGCQQRNRNDRSLLSRKKENLQVSLTTACEGYYTYNQKIRQGYSRRNKIPVANIYRLRVYAIRLLKLENHKETSA